MSIGSSLSGITFGGLSSGIDTESMISRLIQLETVPIKRLQTQQAQLTSRLGVLNQFKGKLTSLATSAGALNSSSTFNPIKASSSSESVATITGTSSAATGTYQLSVTRLAQAQKLASSPQAAANTALGEAGTVVVNGKAVVVEAGDTLSNMAQKINSANAGVVASIIDGGTGNAYLTLTSNRTGAANAIQLADASGSVLGNLGVLSGAATAREAVTGGFASFGFSAATTAVATMIGASGMPAGTLTVNGTSVAIDLATDSLQGIADKINTSGSGATALVKSVVKDGATRYKLEITGVTEPTLVDDANILQTLGIYHRAAGNELLGAQDASFSLDDIPLTSETNTISTVIPGATLTLLKANSTTPETSTLSLSRDDEAISKKVTSFMDAFNGVVEFIKSTTKFDKETFASGPLFGDSSVRQIESELTSLMFDTVATGGEFTNLTQLGFDFDQSGYLTLDQSKLTSALAADPESVGALFRAVGTGSTSTISYVSSTDKSRASSTAYDVSISQVATKGSYLSSVAQTSANPGNETLTFGGSLFGSGGYQLVLDVGSTLASTIAKINNDSRLKDLVSASDEGGVLKITSKRYGTTGNFTVSSSLAAAADNSGIGIGAPGTTTLGLDVAGTINGEAATGNGQFLTGSSGNANTAGLQIQYTGTTTGSVGNLAFSKGVGSRINDLISSFTDGVNGLLTATDQGIQAQIDNIDESITRLSERMTQRERDLRLQFQRMEEAISRVQGQATRIQALNAQN